MNMNMKVCFTLLFVVIAAVTLTTFSQVNTSKRSDSLVNLATEQDPEGPPAEFLPCEPYPDCTDYPQNVEIKFSQSVLSSTIKKQKDQNQPKQAKNNSKPLLKYHR